MDKPIIAAKKTDRCQFRTGRILLVCMRAEAQTNLFVTVSHKGTGNYTCCI